MSSIQLSKRKEGALLGKKSLEHLKKTFKVEFTSYPCTVYFSKNNLLKNKIKIRSDRGFGGKCLFINDFRNLQKLKIYGLFLVFVPMTEYLLRLSDRIRAVTFTVTETVWISQLP